MMRVLALLCLFIGAVFALDNGLGRTPQMAWNAWHTFRCNITEDIFKTQAAILDKSGLAAAGYNYVNLDDCWAYARNETTGVVYGDPIRFPSGMKALADFTHALGLKFGLYSDAGNLTCAGKPGSLHHEKIDAETYASWGVDYLKYDNCNSEGLPNYIRYKNMSIALNATGRPIFYSMCNWVSTTAFWGMEVANSWRTTNDVWFSWDGVLSNLDQNNVVQPFAGPGGWNDPDVLEIGNISLTIDEAIAHFSLYSIIKAPLIISADLETLKPELFEVLLNTEVIAVNQDALGIQGYAFKRTPARYHMANGSIIYADVCQNLPAQQFTYTPQGNLQSVLTGECIGQFDGWSCAYGAYWGAALYLQGCNTYCKGQMQKFIFNGSAIVTNFNASRPLCVQIGGPSSQDVFLWDCGGYENQSWTFLHGEIRNEHGNCITVATPTEVWAAPMEDSSVAVVIFNRANITMEGTIEFSDFGFHTVSIRDLWAHQDLGSFNSSYTRRINPHGAAMFRISKLN